MLNEFIDDPQQQKPKGWCPICGMEIWSDGQEVCTRCKLYGLQEEGL